MNKLRFTDGRYEMYGLLTPAHSGRDAMNRHARALAHGLNLLGPRFVCEVCTMCKGTTIGTDAYGCKYCEGTGLAQSFGCAATVSQRHQVLIAASRSLLLDFKVEVL